MTLIKTLAAAALVTAIATPVFAQEIPYGANGYTGRHSQYTGNYGGYGYRGYRGDRGFWPGAVVAGAVGTAAAIATAPFNDSYAYDYQPVYNERPTYGGNGFVCTPGTYYRNSYGHTQICE